MSPFVQGDILGVRFLDIFSTAILCATIYAVSRSRRYAFLVVIMALPAIATNWACHFARADWLSIISEGLYGMYFLVAACIILVDVLQGGRITFDKIYGAVCVYFLIGMI